jgi:hypothetical protein
MSYGGLPAHQLKLLTPQNYLKALCPHIDRCATEAYESEHGTVQFSFGAYRSCFQGRVVEDHLVRFGDKQTLTVTWETM